MSSRHLEGVVEHLRKLAGREQESSDAELLERFIRGRDGLAFTALVERHGAMVLGVCRHVLHHEQDAEDACQATFLVLAGKAATIRRRQSLASWLYGVAYRSARRAQQMATHRRNREQQAASAALARAKQDMAWREMQAVVDEEVSRLPEKWRAPFVLCCVEGKSRSEAASELGWKEGTVAGRLAQARGRLQQRLARRGVMLSAVLAAGGVTDSASAALSAGMVQRTVQAALRFAGAKTMAGMGSAQALLVARGVLRGMALGKLAVGVVLVGMVGGAGVCAHQTMRAENGAGRAMMQMPAAVTAGPAKAPEEKPLPQPTMPIEPGYHAAQITSVSGRVVGPEGKPVVGAQVEVVATRHVPYQRGLFTARHAHLGRTRTGIGGEFRLEVPGLFSDRYETVLALAGGQGQAIGWEVLRADVNAVPAETRVVKATIQLPPEQVIRGRLVTLAGEPAAGVTLDVVMILQPSPLGHAGVGMYWTSPERVPFWPRVVTDEQGQYVLHGVGRNLAVQLNVVDDRFAQQVIRFNTDNQPEKIVNQSVQPAQRFEGTVTYADTGKPVPHASLGVRAQQEDGNRAQEEVGASTDEQGHFAVNPGPGSFFHFDIFPPDGQPYLIQEKLYRWPKGTVKRKVDIRLPRGVLVRGKVSEEGSGKAIARATVQYMPRTSNNPFYRAAQVSGWQAMVATGDDGVFQLAVTPGPCTLLVHAGDEYVLQEIDNNQIQDRRPGGIRMYAHGIVKLDAKPGSPTQEVAVALRRGVSIEGRLVGPQEQPIAEGLMISPLCAPSFGSVWRSFPTKIMDGRFELKGCEPGKTYSVCFVEPKRRWGTMARVTAPPNAGEPVNVHLGPCGRVTARALDRDGQPISGWQPTIELMMRPGCSRYEVNGHAETDLLADSDFIANIDRLNHWKGAGSDTQGRVTIEALIPGATYRVYRNDKRHEDFTLTPGQTLDLGDFVTKRPRER